MTGYFYRRLPDGRSCWSGRVKTHARVEILNRAGEVIIPAIPLRLALLTYGHRPPYIPDVRNITTT